MLNRTYSSSRQLSKAIVADRLPAKFLLNANCSGCAFSYLPSRGLCPFLFTEIYPNRVVLTRIEAVMHGDLSKFCRGRHVGPQIKMRGMGSQFFNRIIAEFGCIVEMASDPLLIDFVRVKAEPRFQAAKARDIKVGTLRTEIVPDSM